MKRITKEESVDLEGKNLSIPMKMAMPRDIKMPIKIIDGTIAGTMVGTAGTLGEIHMLVAGMAITIGPDHAEDGALGTTAGMVGTVDILGGIHTQVAGMEIHGIMAGMVEATVVIHTMEVGITAGTTPGTDGGMDTIITAGTMAGTEIEGYSRPIMEETGIEV